MNKKTLVYIIFIALTTIITACSNTPNSVVMTIAQGSCVESSMYTMWQYTPPSNISNNPSTAPYCMAVTIQNNNSGENANNVQIIQAGMTLSYNVGSTAYSSIIYDPASAQIGISGSNQIVGNVATYDPNNCTTTQGANVITLNQNGGQCTFYLQILGESFPVGVYATNLTYNYTNGNENYSTGVNFNQRVNLYAAGSNGLFLDTSGAWANFTTPQINSGITSIATDNYGNVYAAERPSSVILYNGNSNTTTVGSFPSSFQITSLATDNTGSLYAGTNGGGAYKYNPNESNPQWVAFNTPASISGGITSSSNIIGLSNYQNTSGQTSDILFATLESNAYECSNPESQATSCSWVALSSTLEPESFNSSAITTDAFGVLYTGSGSNVNTYALTSWSLPYTFIPPISGMVSSVAWTGFESVQTLYVGQVAGSNLESSVYGCSLTATGTPTLCIPLISESGNSIYGSVNGINIDGANNVYVVGGGLYSNDFTEATVLSAYIAESNVTATSNWTPIQNGVVSGNTLQVIKSSSMLTSY